MKRQFFKGILDSQKISKKITLAKIQKWGVCGVFWKRGGDNPNLKKGSFQNRVERGCL